MLVGVVHSYDDLRTDQVLAEVRFGRYLCLSTRLESDHDNGIPIRLLITATMCIIDIPGLREALGPEGCSLW